MIYDRITRFRFFFSQGHKDRKGNPVATSGYFSASDHSTSLSQHHSPFSLETESTQSDTTNEYENSKSKTVVKFSTYVGSSV